MQTEKAPVPKGFAETGVRGGPESGKGVRPRKKDSSAENSMLCLIASEACVLNHKTALLLRIVCKRAVYRSVKVSVFFLLRF